MTQVVSEAQMLLDVIDGAPPDGAPPVSFVAAEPLQVVRYTVSQGYVAHFDNRCDTASAHIASAHTASLRDLPRRSGSQARKGVQLLLAPSLRRLC